MSFFLLCPLIENSLRMYLEDVQHDAVTICGWLEENDYQYIVFNFDRHGLSGWQHLAGWCRINVCVV